VVTATRTSFREAKEVAIPRAVARPRPAVVRALSRLETKKLLTSPAFFAGLGLVGAFVLLSTVGAFFASGDEGASAPPPVGAMLVVGAGVGLIAGSLMGANACALRAHRDRLGELFGSLPAPPETRTAAIVGALLAGPVLLSSIVAVVAYPVLRGAVDADSRASIDLALLAQIPLTALAFGTFGIALARWIRHPAAAPVAFVAYVMTGLIWLVPVIAEGSSGIRMGWHYTFLVAAIVFCVSLAFAGDRRQIRALTLPAIALVAVIVSASIQVPPGGLT